MKKRTKSNSVNVNKWKLLPVSWRFQTKEFFNKSTLHGIRYIAETDRPFYERFMWFILTAMGSTVTLLIILSLWKKFQTNPTITGLDTDFHNWDVPFPAVTVCPSNPVNETLMENFINGKWGSDISEEERNMYKRFVIAVAQQSYNDFNNMSEFVNEKSFTKIDMNNLLYEVKMPCEDLIQNCQWKDLDYNCCEGFLPTRTENGFCYSFNSLQAYLESLRNEDNTLPKIQYIYETDSKWSLVFLLKGESQNNIKIFIHSSEDAPSIDMDPQLVWTNQISKIYFSSKHTYTTDDARQLSISQRRCIFHDERKLVTHTKYSYSACMIQCRMETAVKFCGCVPNFYKPIDGFKLCSLKGLTCLATHVTEELQLRMEELNKESIKIEFKINFLKTKVMRNEFTEEKNVNINQEVVELVKEYVYLRQLKSSNNWISAEVQRRIKMAWSSFGRLNIIFKEDLDRSLQCPCELGCENTVYEVEKLVDSERGDEPLEVGFVSWPMVRYKREVLFGWVDLLVSFGGIAGLFLGFSLLTGAEIIYYFTMRAFCMVYHNTDEVIQMKNKEDNKSDELKFKGELQTAMNALYTNKKKNEEIFTLPFLH